MNAGERKLTRVKKEEQDRAKRTGKAFDCPYERAEFIRAWIEACGGGSMRRPNRHLGF